VHSALPPLPSIFERGADAAEDTTQAAVAVPLVLPIPGVEPSSGPSVNYRTAGSVKIT
jgi:hypothetical protein